MQEGTVFGVCPRDTKTRHPKLEIRPRCMISTRSPEPQPSPGSGSHLSTEALAGIGNGLRGHERRGPGCAGQLGVVPLKLVADPEVGDLHMAIVPQEQVGRLDVPVDDLLIVHCRESGYSVGWGAAAQSPPAGEPASSVSWEGAHTHSSHEGLGRGLQGPPLTLQ